MKRRNRPKATLWLSSGRIDVRNLYEPTATFDGQFPIIEGLEAKLFVGVAPRCILRVRSKPKGKPESFPSCVDKVVRILMDRTRQPAPILLARFLEKFPMLACILDREDLFPFLVGQG